MDVDKDNKVTFEEFKRCFKNLGIFSLSLVSLIL